MAGLARWTTRLVWLALALALLASAWFATQWLRTARINATIRDRSIEQLKPLPADLRARYAAAWFLERSQHYDEAVKLLTEAQGSQDPVLAADSWFALGNVYFQSGIKASRESSVSGALVESAQFDLARDAYRAALRIQPQLHGVRYNLELLERMSPRRAEEGWRRNTDPITIQPDRHNGWTTIQESPKRGLP
jgi:tetratricopeptide (TPR) repeat protein